MIINPTINLSFEEQISFFRQKLNIPTQRWTDVFAEAHDRAFMVAGATKADLLNDLKNAVDKAISEGKGIFEFRQDFDNIVAKHGWIGWRGEGTEAGRAWRTRVIYDTNISTSYAAGRWQQLNDPDLLKMRPNWKYVHADGVRNPRPWHVSWNGTVLPAGHPWWLTHFPPNGWFCHCRVTAVRASEYKGQPAPNDGTYTKLINGQSVTVPNGIDIGFNYAPGASLNKITAQALQQKAAKLPPQLASQLKNDLAKATAHKAINLPPIPSPPATLSKMAVYKKAIKDWITTALSELSNYETIK
jgi:uncharacterized protein with gpF-like domain